MIHEGWLEGARRLDSPNYNARPDGVDVDLLVIHNISLPPGEYGGAYVEDFFLNRLEPSAHAYFASIADLRVSAHLFIQRCGTLIQFVSLDKRAWHAGESCYMGRTNCNDFSIGIELEGTDKEPYAEAQYRCLVDVCALIMNTYRGIRADRIVGHSEIAPGRKTDPGDAFDWSYFRHAIDQYSRGEE